MDELQDYELNKSGIPNVGQFGWTSTDLTGVTDMMVWVLESQKAAKSASDDAQVCQDISKNISDIETVFNSKIDEVDMKIALLNQSISNLQPQLDSFNKKYDDFNVKHSDFLFKYDQFLQKLQEFLDKLDEDFPEGFPEQ